MNRKRHQWTKEEIEKLTELYPMTCICDIADTMNMSTDMVRRKANSLGLQRAEGFTSHNHYGRYVKKGNHL